MSQVRKLQRRQQAQQGFGKALGQLTEAAGQVAGLNATLKDLPKLLEEIRSTSALLDTMQRDYQTLQAEQRFLLWVLRRTVNLTPEQEASYRREFKEIKDSGCPQGS